MTVGIVPNTVNFRLDCDSCRVDFHFISVDINSQMGIDIDSAVAVRYSVVDIDVDADRT